MLYARSGYSGLQLGSLLQIPTKLSLLQRSVLTGKPFAVELSLAFSARCKQHAQIRFFSAKSFHLLTNWLLRNSEVHYRPYISSSLVPIFSPLLNMETSDTTPRVPPFFFHCVLFSNSCPSRRLQRPMLKANATEVLVDQYRGNFGDCVV